MDVNFFKIKDDIPEYKDSYRGFFVLDGNDNFYIGTESGWRKIIYDDQLEGIDLILDNILGN